MGTEPLIRELLTVRPMPDTEDTIERAGHMNIITKEAEEQAHMLQSWR